MEMKINEKLAAIRAEAIDVLGVQELDMYQIGTSTYVLKTELGYAKVAISAIKDTEYDAAFEQEQYLFEKAEKERVAQEKAEIKAKEKAAKIAKREAAEAAKAKAETAKAEA